MASTSDFLLQSPPLRPFDLRFHTRHESPAFSMRSSSPSGSVGQSSRMSSVSINFDDVFDSLPSDDQNRLPWDVVRWTKLRKLSSQVYSEAGKNQFGPPTCVAVASTVAIGTAKGLVLMFDYNQNLLCALGSNINMSAAGAVTSVAFSHDHTYIASGHEHGHIYVWHIKRPLAARVHILPFDPQKPDNGRRDGHVYNAKILHIGFMGKRHSVFTSADDKGMAFLHVSTQQIVGKQIKTSRLVGRYPSQVAKSETADPAQRQKKATSVLAFAPMPLGSSTHPLESRGLVALMTPHILVIISTSPYPQTRFKVSRPKSIADTMGLSGCMDWFPAVSGQNAAKGKKGRAKQQPTTFGAHNLNPRLAYCWSNVVTILEVSVAGSERSQQQQMGGEESIKEGVQSSSGRSSNGNGSTSSMEFMPIKQFVADEAIVALRWLNSQIIVLVTITQRLLILNEVTMHVTDIVDLVPRQIMRHDYFSSQLNELVIRGGHGGEHYATIPDAFFNSFRTFKGRVFLLGSYEFAVGHLSSWAERLDSLIESEKFAEGIRLSTKYYNGEADQVTIGLPEDETARHAAVYDRLVESVLTGLRFILVNSGSSTPSTPTTIKDGGTASSVNEERQQEEADAQYRQIVNIAESSFDALYAADALDVLFESVYEYFENANLRGIYFETLEPYILTEKITILPPMIVKEMINIYASLALNDRLEEIICHLDTRSLDIDQVTMLCRSYELYDALIYVWNQALADYISPMADFVALIGRYNDAVAAIANNDGEQEEVTEEGEVTSLEDKLDPIEILRRNISKVYSYLSYIFTGRVYPTGQYIESIEAEDAKASLYYFLFLGSTITWPRENGTEIVVSDSSDEKKGSTAFPYLRLLLKYDAPAFVAVMNEAFEDTFLNGEDDDDEFADEEYEKHRMELTDDVIFGRALTRQYIVNILLEILSGSEFSPKETIYLDMFIARTTAKYPQFIKLSESMLKEVMLRLCSPPSPEIADDCQLSVEYLLSGYKPDEGVDELVRMFVKARYYRVLRWLFRITKQYGRLVSVFFEDSERRDASDEVFGTIENCLNSRSDLTDEQRREVRAAIATNYANLVHTDATRASEIIEQYMPELHGQLYEKLQDRRDLMFRYLKALFAPELKAIKEGVPLASRRHRAKWNTQQARETYISLLCEFEKNKVIKFLRYLQKGDVRLSKVLSALESAGVIDGEIFLLRSEGQYAESIRRLVAHLDYLKNNILALYPDVARGRSRSRARSQWVHVDEKKLAEVERALQHYVILGTRLEATSTHGGPKLTETEEIWLDLINAVVALTRDVSTALFPDISVFEKMSHSSSYDSATKTILFLRRLVQDVFSALLAATSSAASSKGLGSMLSGGSATSTATSFLRILEAFLARTAAASPSVVDLRNVLANIFEAYIYERQLLSLTNRLLSKDLMVHVSSVYKLRQEGWRVSSPACEICGKRCWGASVVENEAVFEAWDRKLEDDKRKRKVRFRLPAGSRSEEEYYGHASPGGESDTEEDERRGRGGQARSQHHQHHHHNAGSRHASTGDSRSGNQSVSSSYSKSAEQGRWHHHSGAGFVGEQQYAGEDESESSSPRGGRGTGKTVLVRVGDAVPSDSPAAALGEGLDLDNLTLTPEQYQPPTMMQRAGKSAGGTKQQAEIDSLVMFKCKHIYHKKCLERLLELNKNGDGGGWMAARKVGEGYRCIICE
ncbi:Golgi CORVET complex core vacuolar protein 8-domain-containing protein [Myxozyma melibiosi]|uniref:Golgi CORVET complex core vacuolar protein 8-domain-containing protein n=1 Tax=Myxozyma melibiosi TaxID=54550 RepID=A0ABR1FAR6_9ASCO